MDVSAIANALLGLQRATEKLDKAAASISEQGSVQDTGRLVEDIVDLKVAKHSFEANLAVLKTDKEMKESLIDILA